jgi:hypothetical protein
MREKDVPEDRIKPVYFEELKAFSARRVPGGRRRRRAPEAGPDVPRIR